MIEPSCHRRWAWEGRNSSASTAVHQEEAQEDAVADGEDVLVAGVLDRALDGDHAGDHVVEGLAAAVGVVGVVAVLGHPDRPAAQALLLEAELAVAVRLAQLVQGLEHLDRKLERLGQGLGRLARSAQRARQDPRGAELAQVLARPRAPGASPARSAGRPASSGSAIAPGAAFEADSPWRMKWTRTAQVSQGRCPGGRGERRPRRELGSLLHGEPEGEELRRHCRRRPACAGLRSCPSLLRPREMPRRRRRSHRHPVR